MLVFLVEEQLLVFHLLTDLSDLSLLVRQLDFELFYFIRVGAASRSLSQSVLPLDILLLLLLFEHLVGYVFRYVNPRCLQK